MKKLLKFVGAMAALSVAVAGGVALYKRFFAPEEDFSDLDDDFGDEFEDEDLDRELRSERGYVPLDHTAKTAADSAEDVKEAVTES